MIATMARPRRLIATSRESKTHGWGSSSGPRSASQISPRRSCSANRAPLAANAGPCKGVLDPALVFADWMLAIGTLVFGVDLGVLCEQSCASDLCTANNLHCLPLLLRLGLTVDRRLVRDRGQL